jgi:hypothetical protein
MWFQRMPPRLQLKMIVLGVILMYPIFSACGEIGGKIDDDPKDKIRGQCGRGATDRGAACSLLAGSSRCIDGAFCSVLRCAGGSHTTLRCWDDSDCPSGTCEPPVAGSVDGPTQQGQLQEGTNLEINPEGLPSAGPFSSSETPSSYTEPGQVTTLTNFFVDSTATFSVNAHGGLFGTPMNVRTTCTHDNTIDLSTGVSICAGTSRTQVSNNEISDVNSFKVWARQYVTGPGGGDTFDALVGVTCTPGPTLHNVVVDGPVVTIDLPSGGVSIGKCVVKGTISDSRTNAMLVTQHILSISIVPESSRCSNHDDCADMKCVANSCSPGAAGDFCTNPSHCNVGTKSCVQFSCSAGNPTDPCLFDTQCLSDSCASTGFCD